MTKSYIGQDQSLGPNSPAVAPAGRPIPPESCPERPLPRPPPPATPEAPAGRALPQRLHAPRKAKFTLEQLQ